ncbi:hypothetical protein [Pelagibacterium montanilacus]|uniref:hypothetical protein n=1 Tax=Pelagibacterium montanilacus TaxID=2185280 RepID=UPI000F8CA086|nr:hypothetical protein [Pelagibacterium montanilacus]
MSDHNCPENTHWTLNLQHFGNTNIKYLEVSGACAVCGRKVEFRGPMGVSPEHPTASAIDGSEACLPFLFAGEIYDGKGVGYSVSVRGGN